MRLLLDKVMDTEVKITPATPFVEGTAEDFDFETSKDDALVTFQINAPMTIQKRGFGFSNGAFRIYLDGDALLPNGKQWNGYLICNGGGWCFWRKLTTDARFSACFTHRIPKAGKHRLNVRGVVSTKDTSVTLRSRRHYQIIAHD